MIPWPMEPRKFPTDVMPLGTERFAYPTVRGRPLRRLCTNSMVGDDNLTGYLNLWDGIGTVWFDDLELPLSLEIST